MAATTDAPNLVLRTILTVTYYVPDGSAFCGLRGVVSEPQPHGLTYASFERWTDEGWGHIEGSARGFTGAADPVASALRYLERAWGKYAG